jgi:hypothetical protein
MAQAGISLALVILLLSSGAAPAQQSVNLTLLKRDTQIFEGIITQLLKQHFTDPFALTGEPKGVYLQGYGIALSFHITVNRARIRSPWDPIRNPRTPVQPTKDAQVALIKQTMVQSLADYANSIKQLGAHDHITIVAHVEDRHELDPEKSRTVIAMTVTKDNVNLLAMKRISLEAFKERINITQY